MARTSPAGRYCRGVAASAAEKTDAYRPLREIRAIKATYIVLCGKRNQDLGRLVRRLSSCSGIDFAPVASSRGRQIAPRHQCAPRLPSSSGRNTVLPGKYRASRISSFPGTFAVFAGKYCRPVRERTPSCGGRHIVPAGKLYRLVGEKLSSRLGNMRPFLLQKRVFYRQTRRAPCICLC